MLSFFTILILTIFVTLVTERFVKPTATKHPLTILTLEKVALHSLVITAVFLALTLIVQRPIFSALTVMIFFAIVVIVNNTKFKALKEALVFSDFTMFAQAFKHPRLYFGFLGVIPVVLATLIIIGLIILVLLLEPSLPFTWQRIVSTFIGIGIALFFSTNIALSWKHSTIIEKDNAEFGLVNTLYSYLIHSHTSEHKKQIENTLASAPFSKNGNPPPLFFADLYSENRTKTNQKTSKPNITVIQSESFFDARRIHPSIKSSVLENFDQVNAESIQYGKLNVPAWGANTMRTEFSFLTGIENDKLGFYRYYPYQFLAKTPIDSIASDLKSEGYHCVCIHPHPATFFGRDRIFPNMGFDEFIDIEAFKQVEKFGPYISDNAVTDKIIETTQAKTNKPLFIFVITMENHGPLHLEKTTKVEQAEYFKSVTDAKLPKHLSDLTVYLRHLKNADTMIKKLTDHYKNQSKKTGQETVMCFYGDHIPSMPLTYESTNYHDEHSDYFIWHSNPSHKNSKPNNKPQTMFIESLACGTLESLKNSKNQD